jgi:SAM-dependent methyltransferase
LRQAVSIPRPHYDGTAANWREVYQSADPFGRRMQRRRDAVVAKVQERLGDRRVQILDAGCGTGEVARRLASMGHAVVGLDRSADMVGDARRSSEPTDVPPVYLQGDVERLPFRSAFFDVVVCVGVMGYLPPRTRGGRPEDAALPAMKELVRVLEPREGFLLVSVPNLTRLHWLLDPRHVWRALRQQSRLRALAEESEGPSAPSDLAVEPWRTWRWTPGQWRNVVAALGLRIAEWSGIGFGPFSFLGHSLFSSERSVRISARLEKMARRRGLRFLGQLAATWLITLVP